MLAGQVKNKGILRFSRKEVWHKIKYINRCVSFWFWLVKPIFSVFRIRSTEIFLRTVQCNLRFQKILTNKTYSVILMKINPQVLEEYLKSIGQALLLFFLLYIFFWPMEIKGISMEPALFDGDRVIVSRITGFLGYIKTGDMVICKNIEADGPKNIVKRIAAGPGDNIVIIHGEIYINGGLFQPKYETFADLEDMNIMLSKGEYFIVGDNVEKSYDSRIYGPIKADYIKGKVLLKWFPVKNIEFYP